MKLQIKLEDVIFLVVLFGLVSGCKKSEKSKVGENSSHISESKTEKRISGLKSPKNLVENRLNNSSMNTNPLNRLAPKIKHPHKTPPTVPALSLPSSPAPLQVRGFNSASHVAPDSNIGWPKPIVVVLHGNYDRPEWECDTWKRTAGYYGWILCTRGIRSSWASKTEDRWTYGTYKEMVKEIEAAILALEKRYPGKVSRKGMVLAGFSLGANVAPRVAELTKGKYQYLYLVEGGVKKMKLASVVSLKRAGIQGIVMAMGVRIQKKRAKAALRIINRVSEIDALFIDMGGAGHGYSRDFAKTGKEALVTIMKNNNVSNKKLPKVK